MALRIASGYALGERPTLMIVVGGLVVLVSVLALNLERRVVVAQVARV